MLFKKIFANNRQWIASKLSVDPEYFQKLARGQRPDILYIGCSDSRADPEEMMGLGPGDVFEHRNIANLVVSTDNNCNAVVQYAVEHLKVKHIIVCGHYECGGIKEALHPSDVGQLNSWLQTLRDVLRLHQRELNAIEDQRKRFDRLVELNVIEQCINVIKIDHVQKSFYKSKIPTIHGWVFDVRTGRIIDLNLKMRDVLGNLRQIYDLKLGENDQSAK